jgi:hypothetical protein
VGHLRGGWSGGTPLSSVRSGRTSAARTPVRAVCGSRRAARAPAPARSVAGTAHRGSQGPCPVIRPRSLRGRARARRKRPLGPPSPHSVRSSCRARTCDTRDRPRWSLDPGWSRVNPPLGRRAPREDLRPPRTADRPPHRAVQRRARPRTSEGAERHTPRRPGPVRRRNSSSRESGSVPGHTSSIAARARSSEEKAAAGAAKSSLGAVVVPSEEVRHARPPALVARPWLDARRPSARPARSADALRSPRTSRSIPLTGQFSDELGENERRRAAPTPAPARSVAGTAHRGSQGLCPSQSPHSPRGRARARRKRPLGSQSPHSVRSSSRARTCDTRDRPRWSLDPVRVVRRGTTCDRQGQADQPPHRAVRRRARPRTSEGAERHTPRDEQPAGGSGAATETTTAARRAGRSTTTSSSATG